MQPGGLKGSIIRYLGYRSGPEATSVQEQYL